VGPKPAEVSRGERSEGKSREKGKKVDKDSGIGGVSLPKIGRAQCQQQSLGGGVMGPLDRTRAKRMKRRDEKKNM